jgi:ActR/RegA family two-component response regulator
MIEILQPRRTAIILCEDAGITSLLIEVMEEFGLSVQTCVRASTALYWITRRKLDLSIIDFSMGHEARVVLDTIRASASNKTSVTFAITTGSEDTARALKLGSHFALERPLTADSIRNTLKAAYGLILRERRRYFRCAVRVPAVVVQKGAAEMFGTILNVSENGIAFSTSNAPGPGAECTVNFQLPDPEVSVSALCKVCWSNDKGEVGLAFQLLSFKVRSELQAWLSRRLEEQLPDFVSQKFRPNP